MFNFLKDQITLQFGLTAPLECICSETLWLKDLSVLVLAYFERILLFNQ